MGMRRTPSQEVRQRHPETLGAALATSATSVTSDGVAEPWCRAPRAARAPRHARYEPADPAPRARVRSFRRRGWMLRRALACADLLGLTLALVLAESVPSP